MVNETASGEDGGPTLPPSTAPTAFTLSVSGKFDSEEQAQMLANNVYAAIRILGSYIDLERLDGVTIADDYDGALKQLDRGFTPSRPLTRSNSERITGVAMSPAVKRDGAVKAHLLFAAWAIRSLLNSDDQEAASDAIYTIAHECGHVEDLKLRDEAFPGLILSSHYVRYDEAAVGPVADTVWEEYAACRISAPFAKAKQVSFYETGLRSALDGARDRSNAAIREYRLHRDLNRGVSEAGEHICEPLRMFGYLLGTLDGHEATIEEAAPDAVAAIAGGPYAELFARTQVILRDLWANRRQWLSTASFEPMRQVVRDALKEAGVILTVLPDGQVHVGFPFLPGTLPSDSCTRIAGA